MKRSIIIILLLFCLFQTGYSYELVGHSKINYFEAEEIKKTWKEIDIPQLFLPINNGVHVYEITYITEWHDGSPVKATGLVMVPDNLHPQYSTIIYHNGTNIMKKREDKLGYNQFSICAGLAADGYLVVVPDYIGRGNGDKHQLYLHSKTEAQTSVDLLFSTNGFLATLGHSPINNLYITGYSQGGHAALSTQRLIEQNYMNDFNLVASSPMSGPYDLFGTIKIDPTKQYDDALLFMYVVKSYQDIYKIRPSYSEVFVAPFDSLASIYLDGIHNYRDLKKFLPNSLGDIFAKEFIVNEILADSSHFKNILKENSNYTFVPTTPTQFCYCTEDDVVSADNSRNAYQWMHDHGAKNLKIKNAGKNLDHEDCAIYTIIQMKFFFDKHRDIKHSTFKNDFSNAALSMAKTAKKIFPKIKLF